MAAAQGIEAGQAIPLEGALSFATVVEVLDRLTPLFGSAPQGICINLAGVSETDSAGLALLLELRRRSLAAGRSLQLKAAPAQLLGLAKFFGLSEILELY